MGRIPKHPEERLRRNKPIVQPQTLNLTHDLPIPRLPRGTWSKGARDYWKTIWESPMAVLFIPADVPALVRATTLTQIIETGDFSQGILAELRHLEDRFGLSPLARRHLQWDIDRANKQNEEVAEPKQDDDRFLRVVGD